MRDRAIQQILSIIQQDDKFLRQFLDRWDVLLATNRSILVLLWITIAVRKFLAVFLPPWRTSAQLRVFLVYLTVLRRVECGWRKTPLTRLDSTRYVLGPSSSDNDRNLKIAEIVHSAARTNLYRRTLSHDCRRDWLHLLLLPPLKPRVGGVNNRNDGLQACLRDVESR